MKVLLLLVLLIAAAHAQTPTVNFFDRPIPQNVGYISFSGTGFQTTAVTSGNAGQFRFTPIGPAGSTCQPGCVDETMTINRAGTLMTCLMVYLPDTCVRPFVSNPLIVQVFNQNGNSQPIQVGVYTPTDDFILADAISPPTAARANTGICITGDGFPALGSIPQVLQNGKTTGTLVLTMQDDNGVMTTANVHDADACIYENKKICCRYAAVAFTAGDAIRASLLYSTGAAPVRNTNWPAAIVAKASLDAVWPTPTITAAPQFAVAQNQRLLTLTGTNFATAPFEPANHIAISNIAGTVGAGAADDLTCVVREVNPFGTQLICQLYPFISQAGVALNFGAITVTTNNVASAAANPVNAITPVVRRIQPGAQPIPKPGGVLRIPGQGFPGTFLNPGAPGSNSLVTGANPLQVQFFADGNPAPIATCGVQGTPTHVPLVSTVAAQMCVVTDVDNTGITVTYGSSLFDNQPAGAIISALATVNVGAGVDVFPVGGVAPGVAIGPVVAAGVGGDPHFFGFLGERYDFNGEVGKVYNILTDETLQINGRIGLWHWRKGRETIIRTLSIQTGNHSVVVEAGGNFIGSPGFSIEVNGVDVTENTDTPYELGTEGNVEWTKLDDSFKVPIWSQHHAVYKVEISLRYYKLTVLSIEEGRTDNGEWHRQPSRFLDFVCDMHDPSRQPHGLFGQSAHLPRGKRSTEGWSIEGAAADYEIKGNDLLGSESTFNKFTKQ